MNWTDKMIYTPSDEGIKASYKRIEFLCSVGKSWTIPMNKNIRTIPQNSGLHLWFNWIADLFNDMGITYMVMGIECRFTPNLVKEVFKQLALALFDKDSTAKLTTSELDELVIIYQEHISKMTGEFVKFPDKNDLIK